MTHLHLAFLLTVYTAAGCLLICASVYVAPVE
jgi:hypothetical protein